MIGAIGTAAAGLQRASDLFDASAGRIAQAGTGAAGDSGDLAANVVDLLAAQTSVEINAAVLRSADQTQKRLIDILA